MKQKNPSLIIGFSIPIAMIIFVAVSIYLPSLFSHPQYNFIYSSSTDYYETQIYSVQNGQLTENLEPGSEYVPSRPYIPPQLYLYNIKTNESTPISLTDAQKFKLTASTQSPDGYTVENGSNSSGGFFLFFWSNRDYTTEYLVGNNMSKKLNVKMNGATYYTFHFIGWVIQ